MLFQLETRFLKYADGGTHPSFKLQNENLGPCLKEEMMRYRHTEMTLYVGPRKQLNQTKGNVSD